MFVVIDRFSRDSFGKLNLNIAATSYCHSALQLYEFWRNWDRVQWTFYSKSLEHLLSQFSFYISIYKNMQIVLPLNNVALKRHYGLNHCLVLGKHCQNYAWAKGSEESSNSLNYTKVLRNGCSWHIVLTTPCLLSGVLRERFPFVILLFLYNHERKHVYCLTFVLLYCINFGIIAQLGDVSEFSLHNLAQEYRIKAKIESTWIL